MRGAKFLIPVTLLAIIVLISACSILSTEMTLPELHPMDLGEGRAVCSECHEDQIKGIQKPYATFNHTPDFVRSHRLFGAQDERLCAICHRGSFCNDCHTIETENKPSIKLGNRPDRELIHRGDYQTLHMIDGKVDPTSCYKCHGRANNEKCVECHRAGGKR